MPDLDDLLHRAARQDDWTRVVHRCAWCKRVSDEHGTYRRVVAIDAATVVTDGMCPACGRRALAQLAARQAHRARPAA